MEYHFLTDKQFARQRDAGEFLESIEVFGGGQWYGTPYSEVRPFLASRKWVLLEIDVDGAQDVLSEFPEALTIFIRPGSMEELERRLRSRATETAEAIERRLRVARRELQLADRYEYQIVNDTVSEAVDEICQILQDRGLPHD